MSNGNSQNGAVVGFAKDMPVAIFTPHIHSKSDNVEDRSLSQKAEQDNNAQKGMVKSRVTRIPKVYAGPMGTIEGKIRQLFYKEAIQLGQSFAVPLSIFPAFKARLDGYIQEYDLLFAKMVEAVESGEMETVLRAEAGDLIEKIKIPSVSEIRNGYGVDVSLNCNFDSQIVQTALSVLAADVRENLKKDVEASVKRENEAQLSASSQKIISEVKSLLKDINTRCNVTDSKGLHYETLIDKIERVTKVLPVYNVTGDKQLSDLLETIRQKFDGLNKKTLKSDATVRESTVKKAQEITAGFAQMF